MQYKIYQGHLNLIKTIPRKDNPNKITGFSKSDLIKIWNHVSKRLGNKYSSNNSKRHKITKPLWWILWTIISLLICWLSCISKLFALLTSRSTNNSTKYSMRVKVSFHKSKRNLKHMARRVKDSWLNVWPMLYSANLFSPKSTVRIYTTLMILYQIIHHRKKWSK